MDAALILLRSVHHTSPPARKAGVFTGESPLTITILIPTGPASADKSEMGKPTLSFL
jgi:hypothetical protein